MDVCTWVTLAEIFDTGMCPAALSVWSIKSGGNLQHAAQCLNWDTQWQKWVWYLQLRCKSVEKQRWKWWSKFRLNILWMQKTPKWILTWSEVRRKVKKQVTKEVVHGSGRLIYLKKMSSVIFLLNSSVFTAQSYYFFTCITVKIFSANNTAFPHTSTF